MYFCQYINVLYIDVIYNEHMTNKPISIKKDEENRRAQLKRWIDDHFNGVQNSFIKKYKLNQGEISALLRGGRTFGEIKARTIESQTGMPEKYLDRTSAGKEEIYTALVTERIPVVGSVKLGDKEAYFAALDAGADGYIEWPTRDPGTYALRCVGDSMMPRIKHGEFVIIEPNHEVVNGDEVVVKDLQERVMVKIFSRKDDDRMYFESVNNAYAPFPIDKKEIQIMHYVAGIVKSALHKM